MLIDHSDIKKAIIRSQHCQRNFDLSKQIPEDDVEILIYAATNCPSKQNVAFYNLHVISDRNLIENIHKLATGAGAYDENGNMIITTNSQVLANMLFVFEQIDFSDLEKDMQDEFDNKDEFKRDRDTAIGIASGYVNLTASILGYTTGCCQCFQVDKIKKLLNLKNKPAMIQGIGFKDLNRNRRIHHENGLVFPTKIKQPIKIMYK